MGRRGRASIADHDAERCVALTVMTEWKRHNKREQRCPFRGRYMVQGKLFCKSHAYCEAVAICQERGDLKRIAHPPHVGSRVQTIHGGKP